MVETQDVQPAWINCITISTPGSRSQTHVQTFATKFWHVQTFQTKIRYVQSFATKMIRRDYRDRSEGGAIKTSRLIFGMSRLSRPRVAISRLSRQRLIRRDPAAQETASPARPNLAISRLSRPRWRRRDFPDQHGDRVFKKKFSRAFSTEVETARLSRPWWIPRDSGNGATKKCTFKTFATKVETTRLSRPRRRRRDQ